MIADAVATFTRVEDVYVALLFPAVLETEEADEVANVRTDPARRALWMNAVNILDE